MRRRLRPHRRSARRPRHQGRGQSRASGQPRRALRPRPVLAAGPLQSGSLPRPDEARRRALVPTTWDDAISTSRRSSVRPRAATRAARWCLHQPARAGVSFPALLDQILAGYGAPAHLSYDAEAPVATVAGQPRRLRHELAGITTSPPLSSSSPSRRLPRWLGCAGAAAARVRRGPRQGRGRAALHLCGCAPHADRPQRRFVDPGPPGSELAIVNALLGRGSLASAAERGRRRGRSSRACVTRSATVGVRHRRRRPHR
jgi:hypothetical protein